MTKDSSFVSDAPQDPVRHPSMELLQTFLVQNVQLSSMCEVVELEEYLVDLLRIRETSSWLQPLN